MNRMQVGLGCLAVVLGLAGPCQASAATINVTTTSDELGDNGQCSLRAAVIAANTDAATDGCPAGQGTDTIVLPAGTYKLTITGNEDDMFNGSADVPTSGDLDITAPATIQGAGADSTTIDANGKSRAIDAFADVEIDDVTITDGRNPTPAIPRPRSTRWRSTAARSGLRAISR